jgi:hypothetical protein
LSPALAIEIEAGPIERARADLVIVSFASGERPLRGAAGRADWRLCGRLSRLLAERRVEGHAGEAVLLPGGGGLRAPLLLALGRGPAAAFGPAAAAAFARDAVARGLALGAKTLALALPGEAPGEPAPRGRLEFVVAGAAEALAARGGDASVRLLLGVGLEEGRRALEALRAARPIAFPGSVTLRLPSASGRRAGALPGRAAAASGARPPPFK